MSKFHIPPLLAKQMKCILVPLLKIRDFYISICLDPESVVTKMSLYEEYNLLPDTELRFEVEGENTVTIQLQHGLAEIFGREIVLGLKYDFQRGSKIAVFTWHGCKIRLYGQPEYSYICKETAMLQYLNIHCGLEQKRNAARRKNRTGPVTMIVGAHDVGKSTLSKILLNYAVRTGNRKPMYVDLDIEDNQLSMPGSISALSVESPLPDRSGFSEGALVFHFGHTKISGNPSLYTMLVNQMADIVRQKLENQTGSNDAGVIINTPSYTRKDGFEYLMHIASAFNARLILVVDNESLHHFLAKDKRLKDTTVVPIQKNGGVVQRTEQLRLETLDARIREYFYGCEGEIFPFSVQLPFAEVKLWRVGGTELPESCLPAGMSPAHRQTQMVPAEICPSLLHHLIAMSHPTPNLNVTPKKPVKHGSQSEDETSSEAAASAADEDKTMPAVAGFLCVSGVDLQRKILTVLSVDPKPVHKSAMLLSSVQFYDQ